MLNLTISHDVVELIYGNNFIRFILRDPMDFSVQISMKLMKVQLGIRLFPAETIQKR